MSTLRVPGRRRAVPAASTPRGMTSGLVAVEPGQACVPEFSHRGRTLGRMTPAEHQPWCTHHHHVDLTDAADVSNGGAEDWCCYRGPRDSSGRRVEITDHNRFLGAR